VEVCEFGVHDRKPGFKYFAEPHHHLCIGAVLREDRNIIAWPSAPKGAFANQGKPHVPRALGDFRWTADLILATWKMAEDRTAGAGGGVRL